MPDSAASLFTVQAMLMSTKGILVYDLGKEEPYSISQAKSQIEILNEYLGVPTAMPVWAERSLTDIPGKYLSRENSSSENS